MLKFNHKSPTSAHVRDVLLSKFIMLDVLLPFGRKLVLPIAVPLGLMFLPRIAILKTLVSPMMHSMGAAFCDDRCSTNATAGPSARNGFATLTIFQKRVLHPFPFKSSILERRPSRLLLDVIVRDSFPRATFPAHRPHEFPIKLVLVKGRVGNRSVHSALKRRTDLAIQMPEDILDFDLCHVITIVEELGFRITEAPILAWS